MADKKLSTESYKGVRDFYPEDFAVQKYIFSTMRAFVEKCGYEEYNASILEPSELYKTKNAENEEIVNEQTYSFIDRGEREVTLRPEMTPTVARMVAARRRELPFPLRWYSIPNVFRYERPQRGRLREHWQLNVDLFGSDSLAADVELISMAYGLMHAFGATDSDFEIRVNSRQYLHGLTERLGLDHERSQKLLRLLDARKKMPADEFEGALKDIGVSLSDIDAARVPEDVAAVLKPLQDSGFNNIVHDPSIVRGFNYYTGIVFEVFDTNPENNRSLFGGGRYDNLLDMFGEHVPAAGFGMGDVTIHDFLAVRGLIPPHISPTKVYLAVADKDLVFDAMTIAGELRRAGVNVAVDLGDKKLGDQLKTADKLRVPYLIVVGKDELQSGIFAIRDMAAREEKKLKREDLSSFFMQL